MANRIREEGFEVRELPSPESLADAIDESDYGFWLGVDSERDAKETGRVLDRFLPDWLVVDHYSLDTDWETSLRSHTEKIAVIDDLANRKHNCDLLLDQNYFHGSNHRYSGLINSECRQLLGPQYALLGPEYSVLRRQIFPRCSPLSRILVFYGGVDPTNETCRALRVLSQREFQHLVVDIVYGAGNLHRAELEALAAKRKLTNMYDTQPNLAGLIAKADLALGAGGTTNLERCALGLPSIVTAVSDNQVGPSSALANDQRIYSLGRFDKVTDEKLTLAITELMESPEQLGLIAKRAWDVTDAEGATRLANIMYGD